MLILINRKPKAAGNDKDKGRINTAREGTVASYRAVSGALSALRDQLKTRIVATVGSVVSNADVRILGTQDLKQDPSGSSLGIYLHRISVDPFGRNRYLKSGDPTKPPQPELPVNLHLLLIGWSSSAANESTMLAWGMQQIGSAFDLDVSHMGIEDPGWGEGETVQVIPEEMTTEDLLRIWDGLPRDYILSSPYLIKTLRLSPYPEISAGPPVRSLITPMGVVE